MDIIDVSPDDLVLRADILNCAVVDGYRGPITYPGWDFDGLEPTADIPDGVVLDTRTERDGLRVLWHSWHKRIGRDNRAPIFLRFDCRRSEVRDRLRRVLAAGERCFNAACVSGFLRSHQDQPDDCPVCRGGDDIPAHDLGWITDAELSGRITPTVAAALWWCSVLRVEAGMGPVRSVLREWRRGLDLWLTRNDLLLNTAAQCAVSDMATFYGIDSAAGWWCDSLPHTKSGPETGDAGKLAADTAALAAGFALLNADHILLPLPDRIARLHLTDNSAPGGREE